MTVVGIYGLAACGSTFLGYALAAFEGVTFVGEAHWIVDHNRSGKLKWPVCGDCLSDCHLFTSEFVSDLRADPTRMYRKIRDRAGGTIVVSDKGVAHYNRFGNPDIKLLLIREPVKWCASKAVREKWRETGIRREDITSVDDDALLRLARLYDDRHRQFEKLSPTVVDMTKFSRNPVPVMKKLARMLGVRWTSDCLELQRGNQRYHRVNGSFQMRTMAPSRGMRPTPDTRARKLVSDEMAVRIIEIAGPTYTWLTMGAL